MILHNLITATIVLLAPQQTRVSAQLSTNTVSIGETFTLQIVVENASGNIDISDPAIPPSLNVIGTQDFSEMQFSLPGGRREVRRREFALMAVQPGRFRIPSIVVVVGRRAYKTNPLDLVVTGAPPAKSVAGNSETWLRAMMQPETVYVGQQSTLTVEAGFSEEVRVRLTRPPAFDTPSPQGFWVQDVPGGPSSQLRSVNGRVMEIQKLQRAYFPLAAGRFAFAPARAVIDVREGFLFAPETHEIRSSSPRLTVLPLPAAGQPRDFRGAVGTYLIRAYAVPDTVAVGEATQLTVEIAGAGNIKSTPQPALPAVPGVEQFAPTEDAESHFEGAQLRGVKHFQWVLIPQRVGRIEIPPVSFSYFDPGLKRYRTIRTSPVSIVAKAAGMRPNDRNEVALLDAPRRVRHAPFAWVHSRAFLFLQAVPLLVIAALLLQRQRLLVARRAETPAAAIARLRTHSGSYDQFLRELEIIVRNCDRDSPSDRSRALLARIERQRFAPAAAEAAERSDLLHEAEGVCK